MAPPTNGILELLGVLQHVFGHLVSTVHQQPGQQGHTTALVVEFCRWAAELVRQLDHDCLEQTSKLSLLQELIGALKPIQHSAVHVEFLLGSSLRALVLLSGSSKEEVGARFSHVVLDCILEFAFTTAGARALCFACWDPSSAVRCSPGAESHSTCAPAQLLRVLCTRLAVRWRARENVAFLAAQLQSASSIGCQVLGEILVREVLHEVWKLPDCDDFPLALACDWNEEPFVQLLRQHMDIIVGALSSPHALYLLWPKLQQVDGDSIASLLRVVLLVSDLMSFCQHLFASHAIKFYLCTDTAFRSARRR